MSKPRPKPKICYAAIFKNESRNVYRCLDSIKKIIDCVSICDTGSTDNTVELIEKWGKENDVPTKVHHGPQQVFKNFGYNRTLSYKKAVESFPSADYLLLIDADMVIKIEKDFDPRLLEADSYQFEQVSTGLRYWNVRLISALCKWECVGVTHEYWQCKKEKSSSNKIKSLWINDIGDGGSKENKFKRDIQLLTKGIEEESDKGLVGRYKFYLANSYKDSGNPRDAIGWYKKRIEDGGWNEEIFYSYLNMGTCYIQEKDHSNATEALLLAWDKRPTRSEPLYELSRMYREKGNNTLALFFAEKGSKITYPHSDSLFIQSNVYDYLLLEEISIAGFYCGDEGKQKGRACVIKLLTMKDKISADKYNLALSNAKHYGIDEALIKNILNK